MKKNYNYFAVENMRRALGIFALVVLVFGTTVLAQKERNQSAGAVFAMTNATAGNEIVTYGRATDGTLTRLSNVRTRGLGMGVDTDTQGPLRLSADNRFLLCGKSRQRQYQRF